LLLPAGTMTLLPFRVDPGIRQALGTDIATLAVLPGPAPRLRGELPRPAMAASSFLIRIHTRNGIPVASVPVHVSRGDRVFETAALSFAGMEGYGHLPRAEARCIEARVWARRAYATGDIDLEVGHPPPSRRGVT
jgi:hypothetical protein